MRYLVMTAALLFFLVGPVDAVDLATTFGASAPFNQIPPQSCYLQAVHAGNTVQGSVGITANGTDSAVISLQCLNTSITSQIPTLTVNGRPVTNVTFPQTVTSTAPGIWTIQIGSIPPFTVLAQ